jgi:hypothetical protein
MTNDKKMSLEQVAQSPILLPGISYQPETSLRWIIDDSALASVNQIVTIDSIENGKAYKVNLIIADAANHSFSLSKEQTVTPIKCRRVVD